MTSRHTGLLALLLAACGDNGASYADLYEPGEENAGGETTVVETGTMSFSLAARNLDTAGRETFVVGNSFFKRNWVTAPASTTGIDGLGPTFNARSCSSCHLFDGRGAPPVGDEKFVGLLLRLSVPGHDAHGGPAEEPRYGGQFNHESISTVAGEGTSSVSYVEQPGVFDDGTPYSLRVPTYALGDLAFGPMAADAMVSPRVANHMIGLGLLEAIDEAALVALESDGDISGRANYVWNEQERRTTIGRFGWKANQPTIEQQISGAFLGDMGITSPMFPQENCPAAQTECAAATTGGDPEADQETIDQVTFYSRTLAVPARRDVKDDEVLHGKELFHVAGCASCHTPKHVTGAFPGIPQVSDQTIFPYTDLLLHDMGDDLADNRPDFVATGNEWRTPPLWGLGLIPAVNNHTFLLHDGRARDTNEAILWHGGEGATSRDAYRAMEADERAALRRFVESL